MHIRHSALLFVLISLPSVLHADGVEVDYEVSIPDPASEQFLVEVEFEDLEVDTLRYFMPVWAPGAYDVVHFGQYAEAFEAYDEDGKRLNVIAVDTGAWMIVDPPEELRLRYRVNDIESLDNSPWFGLSDIDTARSLAFANTSALFGYAEGMQEIPVEVTFMLPDGWGIAVALEESKVEGNRYTYRAEGYDELVDAPVQMGKFQRWDFEVKDVPHTITITAPSPITDVTAEEIIERTRKIIIIMSDFFGEIPYDYYLFQFYLIHPTATTQGFGALEHANSSTYLMPWVPQPQLATSLQEVIAHEYWHTWSPKRFHVNTLGPFNYRRPPATTSLWFHEGLTEYYAHALLVRHGLIAPTDFLKDFGRRSNILTGDGQRESITALSRDLPWKSLNEVYPLYVKGPVLGLLLDGEIRHQTGNRKSLDDAMRLFNEEYGDHRGDREFGDDDIVGIIERATGAKLGDFYSRYIDGVESPDLYVALGKMGLRPVIAPEFGAFVFAQEGGWQLRYIYPGFSADATGLRAGDVIVAASIDNGELTPINKLPFRPSEFEDWLARQENPTVTLQVVRSGDTLTFPLKVVEVIRNLQPDPAASEQGRAIRTSMFSL